MPPKIGSRHTFTKLRADIDGKRYLTDRVPYLYRELADNRTHTVRQGDTWFALAGKYFSALPRAAGFFWAICDFQPSGPVVDPTVLPTTGTDVVIPSVATLTSRILGEERRREHA